MKTVKIPFVQRACDEMIGKEISLKGVENNCVAVYKLVPIETRKQSLDKKIRTARSVGIMQEYPTAVIDWRKKKILFDHI